jgi:high-affinity iron transporter
VRPAAALLTISLGIAACDRGTPQIPDGVLTSPQAQHAGGAIFATNCAICHGVSADGNGQRREGMSPPPANLRLPPWSDNANAARTFLVIRDGVRGTAMASWRFLGDQQIWQLVAYVTSLNRTNMTVQ